MNTVGAVLPTFTHQARRVLPHVFSHRGANPFVLSLSEAGLAIPLSLAYLYQAGKAQQEGKTVPHGKWIAGLGEALITCGLVQHTRQIYPLVGLGWLAYEAGMAPTPRDKLEAVVKTGVLFPSAVLGIHAGLWATDGLYLRDATKTQAILKQMRRFLHAPAPGAGSGVYAELHPVVTELYSKSNTLKQLFDNLTAPVNPGAARSRLLTSTIQEASKAFSEAQAAFLKKVGTLPQAQVNALSRRMREPLGALVSHTQASQGYRIFRTLNPAFGYLAAITFVGMPLVGILSKLLSKKAAPGQTLTPEPVFAPLWLDRVVKSVFTPSPSVGGPAAYHIDGPSLLAGH